MTIMHPMPRIVAIWVCTDCYFEHHYPGENVEQRDSNSPPPWSLYTDLAAGEITDWTSDPSDENYDAGGDPEHVDEFSKSRCDGCGTSQWGARFRMADWRPESGQ
jgi:hypothetical protein